MRFIVTGVTSFIGSEFTKLILECGHEVYAVCLKNSTALGRLPKDPALKVIFSTLEEYNNLPAQISGADIFVNFAWYGNSVESRSFGNVQQKNVDYITESLKAAYKIGCRLFVEPGIRRSMGLSTER